MLQVMATYLCPTITATPMLSQQVEITCVNLEGRAIIQDSFGSLGRLRWIAVATFLSLILAVAAFKCTDVPLQTLIHMHNKLSDYIAFMYVYVCMYVCSTLHVYVTSILVDDLMAAWLVEMN